MNLEFLPSLAFGFMLVFARMGTILMIVPGLSGQGIPMRVRLTVAVFIAITILPLVSDTLPDLPTSLFGLLAILAGEMIVGFFIGLIISVVTSALQVAGATIALQTSLASTQVTDPAMGIPGTLVSSFLSVVSITLIFVLNIHHLIIAAMHDSYILFKPGEMLPVGDMVEMATNAAAAAFKVGIQLSAPFIVLGLVFNIGIGILSRLMPQLQVFMIVMPANITIGFMMIAVLIGTLMMWYMDHLQGQIGLFLAQ